MHGSGTPIGDTLELQGLKEAFGLNNGTERSCIVGTNKGNIDNTQVRDNTADATQPLN